ncbi:hypothetical protein Bca52824_053443 [Brassica carinata]|uniref:Uncharacterized protein n=1 Tax=Brassica carinata TaxID=52824 RepID=A0A8X7R6M7_BRACI|nr:hypothetical protein Bca52824_053443 [Brassica carinata]
MEERHHNHEHIVDITSNDDDDSSSSRSSLDELTPHRQLQERASSSNATQLPPPPSQQRADGGRASSTSTRRSPLNSGLWISVEFVVTVAQIVAAIVVMVLAKDEHPKPRCLHGLLVIPLAVLPLSLFSIGVFALITEAQAAKILLAWNNQVGDSLRTRLNGLVDHFKMAIDCFFAVWFVVGNVWIFGGHSSPSDSPKLYSHMLLLALLDLCSRFRENFSQTRGATAEAINALPVYKFKLKAEMIWSFQRKVKVAFFYKGLRRNVLYQAKMPAVASAWPDMETTKK